MHAYKAVGWPVAGAVGVGVGTWVRSGDSGPVLGWAWEAKGPPRPAMGGFHLSRFNSRSLETRTKTKITNS